MIGDPKNSPVFDDVVSKLNQDDSLLFTIISGDLVLYPTVETYRSFLEQRARIRVPTLALPGNHDVALQNHYFYHTIFGRFYYSFVLGDSQFILLDDSNEFRLDPEQLAWLKDRLHDGQRYRYRFVFMHVPLQDPRDQDSTGVRFAHSLRDTEFARELEDLFAEYKVTLLFESHVHAYYDVTNRGLHRIITGGGGAALYGSDPAHAFYHYVKVNVSPDGVINELVMLKQGTAEVIVRRHFEKAWLYLLTFGRLYMIRIVMVLFIVVLIVDGVFEYFYRRRTARSRGSGEA